MSGLLDKSPLKGRKGYFDEGSVFAGGMSTVREYGTDGWFETLGNTYVHTNAEERQVASVVLTMMV